MKTAGSLQVVMSSSHYKVNHTHERNLVLWFLVSVLSSVLSFFFFSPFWTTNLSLIFGITD